GAAVEILRVELLVACVGNEVLIEQLEVRLAQFAVAFPPDSVFSDRIDDSVLVLGGAAGMDAGLSADRPTLHNRGFAVGDGVLVKLRCIKIPVDRGQIRETKLVGAIGAVSQTRFLHEGPPNTRPADTGPLPGRRIFRHGRSDGEYSVLRQWAHPIVGIRAPAKSMTAHVCARCSIPRSNRMAPRGILPPGTGNHRPRSILCSATASLR